MAISNSRIAFPVLVAGLFLLAGCGRPTSSHECPDVVATVDGKPIALSIFEAELDRSRRSAQPADPGQVLEKLLQRERLIARAMRIGLDQDPEVRRSFEAVLITKLKERELDSKIRSLSVSEED